MKAKEISIRSITHVNLGKFLDSVRGRNEFVIYVFDQESYDGKAEAVLNIQIAQNDESSDEPELLWIELDYNMAMELSNLIKELNFRNTIREEFKSAIEENITNKL